MINTRNYKINQRNAGLTGFDLLSTPPLPTLLLSWVMKYNQSTSRIGGAFKKDKWLSAGMWSWFWVFSLHSEKDVNESGRCFCSPLGVQDTDSHLNMAYPTVREVEFFYYHLSLQKQFYYEFVSNKRTRESLLDVLIWGFSCIFQN